MSADVEKLVLLHDDGPPSCCASLFSSPYRQSGAPLGSHEPSAACSLTLYLCLREVR